MYYLGLDLGGTKIMAAVVKEDGIVINSKRILTLAEKGFEEVLNKICILIDNIIEESRINLNEISAMGIGVPGAVNYPKGSIYFLPNLPGWTDFPIRDFFMSKYNIPVMLNNDANAAALAEYTFGNGRGIKNMIFLTVSTGIGAGLIVEGNLVNGAWGTAGEVGHMILDVGIDAHECNCGNKGCWETISSGSAVAKRARDRIKAGEKSKITDLVSADNIGAEHVFAAQAMGDTLAAEVTDRAMDFLGTGIANLVNIINPERVIIGGGVAKVGDLLFTTVREKVSKIAYGPAANVEIKPAHLGEKTGVIGAAALAMAVHTPSKLLR